MAHLESLVILDAARKSGAALAFGFERAGYRVYSTHAVDDALAMAQTRVAQLVVVAVEDVESMSFIGRLREEATTRELPVVGVGERARREEALRAGVDDFVTRPAFIRDVLTLSRLAVALRQDGDDGGGVVGLLEDYGLYFLVRAMAVAGRSGVLELERGRRTGEVHFVKGAVVAAHVGKMSGVTAFHHLLLWGEASMSLRFESPAAERRIAMPVDDLLASGVEFVREFEALAARVGGAQALYVHEPRRAAEARGKIPAEVMALIKYYDGHKPLIDIVEDSPFKAFDTIKITYRLAELGAITRRESRETTPLSAQLAVRDWLLGPGGTSAEAAAAPLPAGGVGVEEAARAAAELVGSAMASSTPVPATASSTPVPATAPSTPVPATAPSTPVPATEPSTSSAAKAAALAATVSPPAPATIVAATSTPASAATPAPATTAAAPAAAGALAASVATPVAATSTPAATANTPATSAPGAPSNGAASTNGTAPTNGTSASVTASATTPAPVATPSAAAPATSSAAVTPTAPAPASSPAATAPKATPAPAPATPAPATVAARSAKGKKNKRNKHKHGTAPQAVVTHPAPKPVEAKAQPTPSAPAKAEPAAAKAEPPAAAKPAEAKAEPAAKPVEAKVEPAAKPADAKAETAPASKPAAEAKAAPKAAKPEAAEQPGKLSPQAAARAHAKEPVFDDVEEDFFARAADLHRVDDFSDLEHPEDHRKLSSRRNWFGFRKK